MALDFERYLVKPGKNVNLDEYNPNDNHGFEQGKEESLTAINKLTHQIGELQEQLYAGHKHKVLIILQAMDTGGKDGLIRSVFRDVDPQGVRVESFKAPTSTELDHDYLWRIHHVVPGKGELTIFNRSHYEDVLVVRVRKLVPNNVWQNRYRHINEFERMLSDEGTLIVKLFLFISKEEQRQRLLARLEEPDKNWKFNPGDLEDRDHWSDYIRAYEDMLSQTSTKEAPWWIVPSNRKWYRDLVAASIILETTRKLKLEYPKPFENLDQYFNLLGGDTG